MSRKQTSILAATGTLVVVAALFVVSQVSWQQYEKRYSDNRERAVTRAEMFLTDEKVEGNDIDALASTLAEISSGDCAVGWAQLWRTKLFEGARQLEQGCESLAKSTTVAAQSAASLQERINQERQVGERISKATRDVGELKAGQYQEAAKIWSEVGNDLGSLEVQDTLKVDVSSMAEAADAIEEAYNELQKADASKKRPGFDDAVVNLQKAHQQLRDVSESSQKSYSETAQQLIESLRAI